MAQTSATKTTVRPAPGIRGRRHEAARQTLEQHGWKLRRVDAAERTRHYTHEAEQNGLMVGIGGRLCWTAGHGSLATHDARAGDAEGIAEAIEAARRVR